MPHCARVASVVIVAVTGPVADEAGHALGVGSAAVTAWGTAKWPVLLILVSLMLALLYWASPNVKQPGVRWILPGRRWLSRSGWRRPGCSAFTSDFPARTTRRTVPWPV